MNRSIARVGLLLGILALGCGSTPDTSPDGPGQAGAGSTYSELYASYFARGTPGHCATAGCHADPGHAFWLCGPTKGDCYTGMVTVGLIDAADPKRSAIADPKRSQLFWVNPTSGTMPFDALLPNDRARDAITAWVAAGAQDN